MGDPNEKFSLQTNRCPADLLQRFMGGISKRSEFEEEKEEDDDEGEIELNLGLSLGGRLGVDKNKLARSSSIAGSLPIVRDDDGVAPPPPLVYQSLMRTSSLPAEMDEWRKKKELQCLRRMEAKRRRIAKQMNKDSGGGGGGYGEEERRERVEREQYLAAMNRCSSGVAVPVGFSTTWAAAARKDFIGGGIDVSRGKGKGIGGGGGGGVSGGGCNMQVMGQPSLQKSIETQWGSSSSISALDNKPLQGSSSCGDMSPASIQSIQQQSNQEVVGSSGVKTREHETESASKRTAIARNKGKEIGTNTIEDMPYVFTKGDGPNGRRIEGILYKYGKGEEVRIMCICHGSFLSPAEFVKHAGGGDVAHPLKHIVVNPHSSSL